ncbi:MAG: CDP-alcohol phosphatidyltransferase family protein [Candidatus Lokiarchaeota archaeon]|nr:CDP-alcohol phosphatidyltransferase family protein [Candidatus Lokiarchaeota archaeon]
MSNNKNYLTKRENQRRILNRFIDRPVKYLVKHKISPDTLSYIGFLFSLATAICITFDGLHFPFVIAWITPLLLFWAGALDVFDGEVARRTNANSMVGAFLDSNLDRLSDAILIISLILGNYINYLLGSIILFLVIMISYIRAKAENQGIDMRGVGMMERGERLIILWFGFIAEIELYFFTNLIFGTPFKWFFPIFISIFTLLLALTVIQRLVFSFRALRKLDNQNKSLY